jgi:nicotinamidase/pyrazinamidase
MNPGDIDYLPSVEAAEGDALLVVDIQNDFMPGGALPVAEGDAIIAGVNRLSDSFFSAGLTVVLTQDWHCRGHSSFATAHKNAKPFDPFSAPGIGPVLWPEHCVQGTRGADFHEKLCTANAHAVIRKGYRPQIDSYSAFLENDHTTETGLDGYLRTRGVRRLFACGLALDYCVYYSAIDGAEKGYEVYCVADLTKPVGSPPDSVSQSLSVMAQRGVRFVKAEAVRFSG